MDKATNFNIRVPLIVFTEDGNKIVYCPVLDICGYGKTQKEAFDSFEITLGEFFLYTTRKKTLESELKRLGWTVGKTKFKKMTPPPMSKLLSENDNFSRIFNNFEYRKIDQEIAMTA